MSTIIATTLSNGSVSVPTATVVNGSAKAWANLNGQGTIALRDSFNVSSVSDLATGTYDFNFTNAMSDANYGRNAASITYSGVNLLIAGSAEEQSANLATRTRCYGFTQSIGASDREQVPIAVFGDLA